MAQAKRQKADIKSSRGTRTSPAADDGVKAAASPALVYWRKEVERLLGQDFDNLDQAVAAIVEAAVSRQPAGTNKEELTLFLTQLFEADPTLREELERLFGLKVRE